MLPGLIGVWMIYSCWRKFERDPSELGPFLPDPNTAGRSHLGHTPETFLFDSRGPRADNKRNSTCAVERLGCAGGVIFGSW
jgi:hypothetical protein